MAHEDITMPQMCRRCTAESVLITTQKSTIDENNIACLMCRRRDRGPHLVILFHSTTSCSQINTKPVGINGAAVFPRRRRCEPYSATASIYLFPDRRHVGVEQAEVVTNSQKNLGMIVSYGWNSCRRARVFESAFSGSVYFDILWGSNGATITWENALIDSGQLGTVAGLELPSGAFVLHMYST
nr:hypothetical protein CFP56_66515 [Quercus suber]